MKNRAFLTGHAPCASALHAPHAAFHGHMHVHGLEPPSQLQRFWPAGCFPAAPHIIRTCGYGTVRTELAWDLPAMDFSIETFDQAVLAFQAPDTHPKTREEAQQFLFALRSDKGAWRMTPQIITESKTPFGRQFGVQILENAIQTQWDVIEQSERDSIRAFVLQALDALSGDIDQFIANIDYARRMQDVVIAILRHVWPHGWPEFMNSALSVESEGLAMSMLRVIRVLAEEAFEHAHDVKGHLVAARVKEMRDALRVEFPRVSNFAFACVQNAGRPETVEEALTCLCAFAGWTSDDVFLNEAFLHALMGLAAEGRCWLKTLELLAAVLDKCNVKNSLRGYKSALFAAHTPSADLSSYEPAVHLFLDSVAFIKLVAPPGTDFAASLLASPGDEALAGAINKLVAALLDPKGAMLPACEKAVYFEQRVTPSPKQSPKSFLAAQLSALASPDVAVTHARGLAREVLSDVFGYLTSLSRVSVDFIFRVCLATWGRFARSLVDQPRLVVDPARPADFLERGRFHAPHLPPAREIVVDRMHKPEEVIIVEEDDGSVIRERIPDVDTVALHKQMASILSDLTRVDPDATCELLLQRTEAVKRRFDRALLNSVAWSTGAISEVMDMQRESDFLIKILFALIALCDGQRTVDDKAIAASCVMYVCSRFPRFLRAYPSFMRAVIMKLFDFMREAHPGVRDMACDVFLSIAERCAKKILSGKAPAVQGTAPAPLLDAFVAAIPVATEQLGRGQLGTFYQAFGCIVGAEANPTRVWDLLAHVLDQPCQVLRGLVPAGLVFQRDAGAHPLLRDEFPEIAPDALQREETLDEVKTVFHVLERFAAATRSALFAVTPTVLSVAFPIYNGLQAEIQQAVASAGADGHRILNFTRVLKMKRALCKQIVSFLTAAVRGLQPGSPLMHALLRHTLSSVASFSRMHPSVRDAEILSFLAAACTQTGATLSAEEVQQIYSNYVVSTMGVLQDAYDSYPELRDALFVLVDALITNCFAALIASLEMGAASVSGAAPASAAGFETFSGLMHIVLFGLEHANRQADAHSLASLECILRSINAAQRELAYAYYRHFFARVLRILLRTLTDTFHVAFIREQAACLRLLLSVVLEDPHLAQNPQAAPDKRGGAAQRQLLFQDPVFDPAALPAAWPTFASNLEFVRFFMGSFITENFPNLKESIVIEFLAPFLRMAPPRELARHAADFLKLSRRTFAPRRE